MTTEDIVSIQIGDEDRTSIEGAIAVLGEKLAPFLIALTPEQRHQIPKVKDKTLPFLEKVMAYTKSNPEIVPKYLDLQALDIDYNAYTLLKTYSRKLSQLINNLDDSIMLSGSEAYKGALTFYNAAKQAAKTNVPGAKEVFEDLNERFKK